MSTTAAGDGGSSATIQGFSNGTSSQNGKPNSHGIDGAEIDPQKNVNESNGHSHHSTTITEKGNSEIMEISEHREINGIYSISSAGTSLNSSAHFGC